MQKRVESCLQVNCWNSECQTVTFKRRLSAGRVTVTMQCDNCGRSVGGPLPRDKIYNWQDFPEWDATKNEEFREKWQESAYEAFARQKKQREQQKAAQRADYAIWLLKSPEWHEIRKLVLARAQGVCEACLSQPAAHVHHRTYDHGILPPAWHLKAVCVECHARIHNADDAWNWS